MSVHGVHLTPNVDLASMRVVFTSPDMPTGTAYVNYGESADALSQVAPAVTRDFTDEVNSGGLTTQWVHAADLAELGRGKTYYYEACYSNDDGAACSDVYSFTTIPEEASHQTNLMMFGDLGHDGGDLAHKLFTALPAMEAEAASGDFDMAVHMGDFAYDLHSDAGKKGAEFVDRIQPLSANVPYLTCPGNHEIMDGNFTHYRNLFPQQQMEETDGDEFRMWFSLDLPQLHLVSLSTEVFFGRPEAEQTAMLDWLAADLDAVDREAQPWVVVFGHRPPYCSNTDHDCMYEGSEGETVRAQLEELLHAKGVDVAVWAHEHSYERTWPVYNLTTLQEDYENPKGVVHVISGAAGCNESGGLCLNPIWKPLGDWSAFRTGVFHPYSYGHLRAVNSTHLFMDQVNGRTGEVFDSVWLVQDSHGPFLL